MTTTPQGENTSHVGLVVDHSPEGLKTARLLCEYFPGADERVAPWRSSKDEFFVYFHETKGTGRAGSMTARDLNDLVSRVLPSLFGIMDAPPARPSFGIAVAPQSFNTIEATIDRLTEGYQA